MSFPRKLLGATRSLASVALLSLASLAQAQSVTPAQVHQDIAKSLQSHGLEAVIAALGNNPYARFKYDVVALTPSCQYLVHTVRPQMAGKYCNQARNPSGVTEWPNLVQEAMRAGLSQKRWMNWNVTWDTWCKSYGTAVICVAQRHN